MGGTRPAPQGCARLPARHGGADPADQHPEKRGVTAESIAAASAEQGDVLARYLRPSRTAADGTSRPVPDAAAEAGLDASFVRRLTVAAGLSEQGELDGDDLEMLRALTVALNTGMPAEALLQLVQVYNDALSRVAEAWFEPVGPRSLKNIAEPVELFEARSRRRVLRRAS